MDVTSIKAILHYLSSEIIPSKFEAAQQPEQNTIQICFRGINNVNWLEISWQGDCARILKIARPEKEGSNSTLAQQLSCGLKYMALVSIKQYKFERVVKLEFAKKPGDEITKYLIVELMGKHSNLFYLDKNLKIIAAGKQVKSNQSSFRTIATGDIYTEPPKPIKKEPCEIESFDSWKKTISIIPQSLRNCLIANYQGVSPTLINQIENYANIPTDNFMNKSIETIEDYDLKKIFKIWKLWIERFKKKDFNYTKLNNYFYSVWLPVNVLNNQSSLELADEIYHYYDHFLKLKIIEGLINKIEGIIFKQTNIERKNLNIQNLLLTNSENHEIYKLKADNIFLKPDLKKTNIIEAEKLYKKSKKLKRARILIQERLNIHKNKINRLEEYSAMLDNLNSLNIESKKIKINLLEELKDEICNEFNIRIRASKLSKKKSNDLMSFPIEVYSPQKLIIQIGRNMRQNDLISFKLSKKGDLWFHAQECPGSHVILKSSAMPANEDDIQLAADLASFFSKARGNIKVPINCVNIKDLQKINKSGMGCVSFKNQEIIWGNPTRGKEYIKKDTHFKK
ncbi:MAG: hypothetical protein CMK49_02535 [Prochlorococcus sp. SP3034]|nr:hypothetical protein [Prochlorococcus sp. SP3034]